MGNEKLRQAAIETRSREINFSSPTYRRHPSARVGPGKRRKQHREYTLLFPPRQSIGFAVRVTYSVSKGSLLSLAHSHSCARGRRGDKATIRSRTRVKEHTERAPCDLETRARARRREVLVGRGPSSRSCYPRLELVYICVCGYRYNTPRWKWARRRDRETRERMCGCPALLEVIGAGEDGGNGGLTASYCACDVYLLL